jgi:hypothetical protein
VSNQKQAAVKEVGFVSQNPLNLALRFALEMAALFACGYWGWTQHEGVWRLLWGIGLPVVAAAIWGIFRTPDDHGKGLLAVPGPVRLLTEWAIFGLAVVLYAAAGRPAAASIMALLVILHYMASYDRVMRLLRD